MQRWTTGGMAMTFHAVGTGTGKELDEKQYRFDWR